MESNIITFASGLRLAHQYVPTVRSVGISILTAAGSCNETVANNGISHFIEHMLFKGTRKRSAFEIVEQIDAIGAQINAFTSKQSTCFYTLSLDHYAERCAEILSDILFESQFDPEETEREKGVVLEEISMSEDDNADVCLDMLAQAYFGEHPLGKTILGPRKNIKQFAREDLIAYIERNYCAESTVISIVGNITTDRAKKLVEEFFEGRFRKANGRDWKDVAHAPKSEFVRKFKDIEQANIAIAMPSYAFADPNDMALMLVNGVVGGGMSSRLFQEIREKQGLAYNVYSYPSTYLRNGTMVLYIGTNVDSVAKSVRSTRKLLDDLHKDGLTRKEFERGKQQLLGAYVLGQENTTTIMRVLAKYALYNDELFDMDAKIRAIEAVTFEQAQQVVRDVYDLSRACVSYVGKQTDADLSALLWE